METSLPMRQYYSSQYQNTDEGIELMEREIFLCMNNNSKSFLGGTKDMAAMTNWNKPVGIPKLQEWKKNPINSEDSWHIIDMIMYFIPIGLYSPMAPSLRRFSHRLRSVSYTPSFQICGLGGATLKCGCSLSNLAFRVFSHWLVLTPYALLRLS